MAASDDISELEHRCKLFTEAMLRFLMKFHSPTAIQTAKTKEIVKALIHVEGKRKRVWISAEEIIVLSKASVAPQSVAHDWGLVNGSKGFWIYK